MPLVAMEGPAAHYGWLYANEDSTIGCAMCWHPSILGYVWGPDAGFEGVDNWNTQALIIEIFVRCRLHFYETFP